MLLDIVLEAYMLVEILFILEIQKLVQLAVQLHYRIILILEVLLLKVMKEH